jgi:hypothetical protein
MAKKAPKGPSGGPMIPGQAPKPKALNHPSNGTQNGQKCGGKKMSGKKGCC